MLTILFAACLLAQQQAKPQAKPQTKPRQQQTEAITIQGRDFTIPHVPATEKQANKEYKAVLKKINSTIDILEDDLAILYGKFPRNELFLDFALSKEKADAPEAKFFSSVIKDEKLGPLLSEVIKQWNDWQLATVQAGAGKFAPSKEPQQNAAPQAAAQTNRLPGVAYEKQKFTVENVPVDTLPALRATLAEWDIKLEAIGRGRMRTVLYQLDLPVVSSLQSVLGLSKSDAKKMRNQKALSTLAMFSTAKEPMPSARAADADEETEEEDNGDGGEELEVELAGLSTEAEAKKLRFQIAQNWANAEIAKVVSGLYAPDFAKAWESFTDYLNGRIGEFMEMEASQLVYQDKEIKRLYDMASIKFMEQLRLSLWLCQNVWHRMSSKMTDNPKPLSRLAPNIVRAATPDNPDSYIVLNEMGKKDLDKVAAAISKKEPRLFMVRLAQPIHVPNEGEFLQPWETTVKVQVAMDGSVSSADYASGPEHLREISLQAAKLLRFYPLRQSGFSAPQSTNISFSFD